MSNEGKGIETLLLPKMIERSHIVPFNSLAVSNVSTGHIIYL